MVVFPNVKINLGLRVLRKREDGYHDLDSVFYPLDLADILEMIPAPGSMPFDLTTSGITVSIDPLENLCTKAWKLLKTDFPDLPPVQLHLHKVIPSGAGLGGGSSDASFTLKLLNDYFQLQLDELSLLRYALQLGSDCPFFILNTPSHATGRGEKLERVSLDLSTWHFVIVNPGIHINTREAFINITPAIPGMSTKEIIGRPISNWKNDLINDFETPVFHLYPEIAMIKDQLYNMGAVYASLSGSGSTVFGIFDKRAQPPFSFPEHYFVHWSIGQR